MAKAKMGTPPKRAKTIGEWYDLGPNSKVTRAELMMVLEGFGFVPAEELGKMIQAAFVLERERKWYRRLWRWLKVTVFTKQKLADLSPEARERVRQELDKIEQPDRPAVVSSGVAQQIEEATNADA